MIVRRVGRPGLIGTVARTAVVAGTASAVAGGVAHRQQARYAQQEAAVQQEQMNQMQTQAAAASGPSAPTAAGGGAAGGLTQEQKIAQLKDLAQLKQDGILTDAEFEAEKQKILAQ